MTTKEIIKRAGRIVKILRLAGNPMMDAVAVRLNSGITYEEEETAKMWSKAFELAADESIDVFEGARRLYERT